jgi:UDP-glucose 4-epimerase
VIGLGHGSWTREEWQKWGFAEWCEADVTLESMLAHAGSPDIIVHCAGSGSVGFSMSHPSQDFQKTVSPTLDILEFSRIHAPQARVVFPSSAGVYGAVQKLPIAESATLSPASPYGVHKRLAEELCESYARHFGASVAVVRLFSVYGEELRKQLLWDASQKIRCNDLRFFGTGGEIRDWLHVEDAASLLITAANHASPTCPIVNGGSGIGVSVREVLVELLGSYGIDASPSFSGLARSGDPAGYVADIALARQWDWQPKMDWREGVRGYAKWFKACVQ